MFGSPIASISTNPAASGSSNATAPPTSPTPTAPAAVANPTPNKNLPLAGLAGLAPLLVLAGVIWFLGETLPFFSTRSSSVDTKTWAMGCPRVYSSTGTERRLTRKRIVRRGKKKQGWNAGGNEVQQRSMPGGRYRAR